MEWRSVPSTSRVVLTDSKRDGKGEGGIYLASLVRRSSQIILHGQFSLRGEGEEEGEE